MKDFRFNEISDFNRDFIDGLQDFKPVADPLG